MDNNIGNLKGFAEEDIEAIVSIQDKLKISKQRDIPIFCADFYPPIVWSYIEDYCKRNRIMLDLNGGFDECDRKMIAFNNIYKEEFPMKVIKIHGKSKFHKLEHRQFLGTILSKGIKREKIGDLVRRNNTAFVPVHNDVLDYLLYSLDKIGQSPCQITIINDKEEIPKIEFKEEIILVNSLRIDNFVAAICKISRGKAQEMVQQGKVLLNYSVIDNKSKDVDMSDKITIRGYGKYVLDNIVGNSKSGKLKVIIKKYT